MINTSREYKKAVVRNREFRIRDKITFSDGSVMELTLEDVTAYSINEATSSPGKFEIGAAVIREYCATFNNMDGRFDNVNFEGADISAKVGIRLEDGTWEDLPKGTYRVASATAKELTIDIKAYDSMLFFDRPYSESALRYPASIREIVEDACRCCDMSFDASTMEMGGYMVQTRPDDDALTFRDVVSYCAQIMGCYARVSHMDRLEFGWYDFGMLSDMTAGNYDGGVFDAGTPYRSGDTLDGGDFLDYSSGDFADAGLFEDMKKYHHIYMLTSQSINTDDIRITGVAVTVKEAGSQESQTCLHGREGYVLEISDNPLIQPETVRDVAGHVGKKITGNTFRPLTVTCQADPCMEAGDLAYVTDRKQRSYLTVITNTTFSLSGSQRVECGAETPVEKTYAKYGTVTRLLAQTEKQTERKLSAYDIAVKQMNQLAANTMGFYSTTIPQPDGSAVAYRHDKPNLSESRIVYKSGIDGFFVTKDYQGTDEETTAKGKWKAGFDADGNAAMNILSVIGINFSWARGGTLTLGGEGNGDGELKIVDSVGHIIGEINNAGVNFNKGTFSGKLSAATGTFKGTLNAGKVKGGEIEGSTIRGVTIEGAEVYGGLIENVTKKGETGHGIRLIDNRILFFYRWSDGTEEEATRFEGEGITHDHSFYIKGDGGLAEYTQKGRKHCFYGDKCDIKSDVWVDGDIFQEPHSSIGPDGELILTPSDVPGVFEMLDDLSGKVASLVTDVKKAKSDIKYIKNEMDRLHSPGFVPD